MKNIQQIHEDVWQTLRGYFHQDSESFESGLEELLKNSSEALDATALSIQKFLEDSKFLDLEKKNFIQDAVDLRFDTRNLDPLEWLQDLAQQIEEKIKQS